MQDLSRRALLTGAAAVAASAVVPAASFDLAAVAAPVARVPFVVGDGWMQLVQSCLDDTIVSTQIFGADGKAVDEASLPVVSQRGFPDMRVPHVHVTGMKGKFTAHTYFKFSEEGGWYLYNPCVVVDAPPPPAKPIKVKPQKRFEGFTRPKRPV